MSNTLIESIKKMKTEKNIIILAHYYQIPEIQDLADFVGDSLALAKFGKTSNSDTLVICGVKFMAETAKILSPEKTILLPNTKAGCPMADMVDAKSLKLHKERHPNHYIVSYVNTSAEVKAMTDVCVTSSNALAIIEKLTDKEILFLPDRNLGHYINAKLPNQTMHFWPGYCITHDRLTAGDVVAMKKKYPQAIVLVHPECDPSVVALGDYVGSTAGIIAYASKTDSKEFIIATEEGVLHPLQTNEPNKKFYLASEKLICRNMKKTTLEDVHQCLLEGSNPITLDDRVISKAQKSLNMMLELS